MATKYDHILEQLVPGSTQARMDDSNNVLAALPLQLTNIEAGVIEKKFVETKYQGIVPVKGGYNPGYNSDRFITSEAIGEAKEIDPSADDFPNVEEQFGYVDMPFKHFGVSYAFSLQDLAAAQLGQRNLDASGAEKSALAIERKIDSLAAIGSGTYKGALNHASVASTTASDDFAALIASEPMKVVDELLRAEDEMLTANFGSFVPNVLVMSTAMRGLLARTAIQRTYNRETILTAFNEMSVSKPTIVTWEFAKTAGPDGKDVIAFISASEGVLQMGRSRDREVVAPERRGLRIVNHMWSSITPVVIKQPLGVRYLVGVDA